MPQEITDYQITTPTAATKLFGHDGADVGYMELGAPTVAPQSIIRCKMAAAMSSPFNDVALPDFLSFSSLVVTLQADATNPFAACFGNGSTNTTSQITKNLKATLPNTATTHWLFVERNTGTGALTLGSTTNAPEYNTARRVGANDWYNPAENVMRNSANAQVQRVYVGKAVVAGGVITAVVPFAPGVEATVPVNNGALLAASTVYLQDNPLGVPLVEPSVLMKAEADTIWQAVSLAQLASVNHGALKAYDASTLRIRTLAGGWLDSTGNTYAPTTARARIRVRRAF